jgi:hypothetical protein
MASASAVHTKSIRIVAKGRGSDGKLFLELKIAEPGRAAPRSRLLSIADYKSNRTETETALGLPIVSSKASNEFRDRVQTALKGPDTFDVAQRPGWYKGWFVPSELHDFDAGRCFTPRRSRSTQSSSVLSDRGGKGRSHVSE